MGRSKSKDKVWGVNERTKYEGKSMHRQKVSDEQKSLIA